MLYYGYKTTFYSMKLSERTRAITLRKEGYSLREVSEKLHISKSTASVWLSGVQMSAAGQQKILKTRVKARLKGLATRRQSIERVREKYYTSACADFKTLSPSREQMRIGAALLYWGEGSKNDRYGMAFMNSDPVLVRAFLGMLRRGFSIHELKLRACVHLHVYHDSAKEIAFWSKITDIPKSQFIKPYQKTNTGNRQKKEYHGCISIRYPRAEMVRELAMIKRAYIEKMGV